MGTAEEEEEEEEEKEEEGGEAGKGLRVHGSNLVCFCFVFSLFFASTGESRKPAPTAVPTATIKHPQWRTKCELTSSKHLKKAYEVSAINMKNKLHINKNKISL